MKKELNKKGFTLVEILAVITIIVIVSILLIPQVLNIFTNAKNDAYDDQISVFITATKKYTAENSYDLVWVSDETTVTVDQLITAGYIKDNPINPKTNIEFCGDSYITITRTGKKYTYAPTMYDDGEGPCA